MTVWLYCPSPPPAKPFTVWPFVRAIYDYESHRNCFVRGCYPLHGERTTGNSSLLVLCSLVRIISGMKNCVLGFTTCMARLVADRYSHNSGESTAGRVDTRHGARQQRQSRCAVPRVSEPASVGCGKSGGDSARAQRDRNNTNYGHLFA